MTAQLAAHGTNQPLIVNNFLYSVHGDGLEAKFNLVSVLQHRLSAGAKTGMLPEQQC